MRWHGFSGHDVHTCITRSNISSSVPCNTSNVDYLDFHAGCFRKDSMLPENLTLDQSN